MNAENTQKQSAERPVKRQNETRKQVKPSPENSVTYCLRLFAALLGAVALHVPFAFMSGNPPPPRQELDFGETTQAISLPPPSDNLPEIAVEAVKRCQAEGIEKLSCLALPDYGPEELGARNHPNAAYNEKIGKITAEYLRELMGIDAKE